MTTNPEQASLEDNRRFGIIDKEREEIFEENYGIKVGSEGKSFQYE